MSVVVCGAPGVIGVTGSLGDIGVMGSLADNAVLRSSEVRSIGSSGARFAGVSPWWWRWGCGAGVRGST